MAAPTDPPVYKILRSYYPDLIHASIYQTLTAEDVITYGTILDEFLSWSSTVAYTHNLWAQDLVQKYKPYYIEALIEMIAETCLGGQVVQGFPIINEFLSKPIKEMPLYFCSGIQEDDLDQAMQITVARWRLTINSDDRMEVPYLFP